VVVAVVLGAVLAKKLSPAVAQRALFATIEHHFYSCFKERTSANMDMRANKQFRKQEGIMATEKITTKQIKKSTQTWFEALICGFNPKMFSRRQSVA
jgi:hypothetical protein